MLTPAFTSKSLTTVRRPRRGSDTAESKFPHTEHFGCPHESPEGERAGGRDSQLHVAMGKQGGDDATWFLAPVWGIIVPKAGVTH